MTNPSASTEKLSGSQRPRRPTTTRPAAQLGCVVERLVDAGGAELDQVLALLRHGRQGTRHQQDQATEERKPPGPALGGESVGSHG